MKIACNWEKRTEVEVKEAEIKHWEEYIKSRLSAGRCQVISLSWILKHAGIYLLQSLQDSISVLDQDSVSVVDQDLISVLDSSFVVNVHRRTHISASLVAASGFTYLRHQPTNQASIQSFLINEIVSGYLGEKATLRLVFETYLTLEKIFNE